MKREGRAGRGAGGRTFEAFEGPGGGGRERKKGASRRVASGSGKMMTRRGAHLRRARGCEIGRARFRDGREHRASGLDAATLGSTVGLSSRPRSRRVRSAALREGASRGASRPGAHLLVRADGALGWNFNLHQGSLRLEVLSEGLPLLVRHLRRLGLGAALGRGGGLVLRDASLARGVPRARASARGRGVVLVLPRLRRVVIGRLRLLRLGSLLLRLLSLGLGLVRGRLRGAALPAHRDRGRSETERSTRRARARVSDHERTRRRTARGGKNRTPDGVFLDDCPPKR